MRIRRPAGRAHRHSRSCPPTPRPRRPPTRLPYRRKRVAATKRTAGTAPITGELRPGMRPGRVRRRRHPGAAARAGRGHGGAAAPGVRRYADADHRAGRLEGRNAAAGSRPGRGPAPEPVCASLSPAGPRSWGSAPLNRLHGGTFVRSYLTGRLHGSVHVPRPLVTESDHAADALG